MKDTKLSKLIPMFADVKATADEYKAKADEYNKQIKELMCKLPKTKWKDYKVAGYNATYREDVTTTLIEEAVIELLKEKKLAKGIVKKKEYVDTDALESAIYKGEIPKEVLKEMNKCQKSTTKRVLIVKKEK